MEIEKEWSSSENSVPKRRDNGDDNDSFDAIPVSTAEAMNPSRRCTMEDVHSIHRPGTWQEQPPHLTFLGLYDGHGGRDVVDFMRHAIPFHVAQELDTMEGDEETRKMKMLRAFLMADIHARKVGLVSSGAAVAVCLIQRTPVLPCRYRLITANVGDSRVVAGVETEDRGKRQLFSERLTVDHQATEPSEINRIEQTGGFCYKSRVIGVLALSRAMGDFCLKDMVLGEPYVRETFLDFDRVASTKKAFVILACDGLWDVMTDREATERVAAWQGDPHDVAQDLVNEGLRRQTADNLTCIVAWLHHHKIASTSTAAKASTAQGR